MSESPRKTQKPVTERLEFGHPAQSLLHNALGWRSEDEGNKIPWLEVAFQYLKTWYAASKWGCLGLSIYWLKSLIEQARSRQVMVK
jgi:hypothetical protein